MEPPHDALNLATLETVNRVARAALLWIRHRRAGSAFIAAATTPEAERELAAGVLAGLCEALHLDGQHALLSAYVYALLNGDNDMALDTARTLVDQRNSVALASAYRDGKSMALEIIAVAEFAVPTGLEGGGAVQ